MIDQPYLLAAIASLLGLAAFRWLRALRPAKNAGGEEIGNEKRPTRKMARPQLDAAAI